MFKYIRGWYDPKKLIQKPLRGSKSPLIGDLLNFWGQKIRPQNIAIKLHKNCIFLNMNLNLFRQAIKKKCLLIAFQQNLSSSQKTADFCRYWQILVKNCCRFIASHLKVSFSIFLLWFSSHGPKQRFLFQQVFCQRSQKWRREAEN